MLNAFKGHLKETVFIKQNKYTIYLNLKIINAIGSDKRSNAIG